MAESVAAVELEGITKRFPGVVANNRVGLRVMPGEVHAIVGENGAGKSTLMKILYGMQRPDEGTIRVSGAEVRFRSPKDAIARGIGMVHQHFMLADNLTVLENVVLGSEPVRGPAIDFARAKERIKKLSGSYGLPLDPDRLVEDLAVGERQRVEIIKVLYRGARILILDEPTAVLVPAEVDDLFDHLRELKQEGVTIIFISHKLEEVLALADTITVMRGGRTVATVKPQDVTGRQLAELMVGSELPRPETRESTVRDEVAMSVRELTVRTKGRREAGISYIPEDRQEMGLILPSPLWENTMLGHQTQQPFVRGVWVDVNGARERTRHVVEEFRVVTPSVDVAAYALSGGNQQKLIVGREMTAGPLVLIAAQPTRGIDVGAQAAVWDQIRRARKLGLGVLLISADLEELIGLSDTLYVIFRGRLVAQLDPQTVTPEELGSYMTGAHLEAAEQ